MKRLSTLGQFRNAADKKMQEVGKKKFPKSLISGLPTQVLHHFFPKSVSSFHRYNWDNLIPLTNGEHMRIHQANDPSYNEIIKKRKCQKWFNGLEKHKRDYVRINKEYYILMLEKLQCDF